MKLTIGIDVASLPTYVALSSIQALQDDFQIDIEWQPLTGGLARLSARKPDDDVDDPLARYKARRQRARDIWAERELNWDCERLGTSTELGSRRFDSTMAALGMLYTVRSGGDVMSYLDAAFARVFREGKSLEEDDVAELAGEDFREFACGDGPALLETLQTELLEAGVYASPAFVLDGEVFQGRQHLPLIRWRLGGEEGPPPV